MPEKKQQRTVQRSMDEGAIAQVLRSEEFLDNLRRNFGLQKKETKVCELCGDPETKPKRITDGERERVLFVCGHCGAKRAEPGKEEEWVERDNPLLNKKGVDGVLQTVAGSVDRNQMLSDFDEAQIRNIMIPLHRKLARELQQNWLEYGIDNREAAHKVIAITTNAVWSVFKRAEGKATLESVAGMGDDKTVTKTETGDGNDGFLGGFSLG